MLERSQLVGDLLVARRAVRDVASFVRAVLPRDFGFQITKWCGSTRFSPLELAAQVLLAARIKCCLPYDTFIAQFRDPNQRLLSQADVSRIIELLKVAESSIPDADKDRTLRRDNTVRSYLDGGGRIHKGGIDPCASHASCAPELAPVASAVLDRASTKHADPLDSKHRNEQRHRSATATHGRASSGPISNVNRVWVLEPVDDLLAAVTGTPFCIGATLFHNGEEILTAIAVPNLPVGRSASQSPIIDSYGKLFWAAKDHGTFVLPLVPQLCDQSVPVRLSSRDLALSDLPGHRAFPRLDVVMSTAQQSTARGGLVPRVVIPPHQLPPPTSPRALKSRSNKSQVPFDQPLDLTIQKADMIGTGPTLQSLIDAHVSMTYKTRSNLLAYICVALSEVQANIYIPYSPTAHHDSFIWREAGGSLIVQEAGGVVTDVEGQDLDFTTGRTLRKNFGILATCPGMTHWRLLDAIKGDLDVAGGNPPDSRSAMGRWAKESNVGPWNTLRGRASSNELIEDAGHPAMLPRGKDGKPKKLWSRTFRYFADWPHTRQTWREGTASGPWLNEDETVKRQVQPGQTAGARYLPVEAQTVPHSGLCRWPCEVCEPDAHIEWYAWASQSSR